MELSGGDVTNKEFAPIVYLNMLLFRILLESWTTIKRRVRVSPLYFFFCHLISGFLSVGALCGHSNHIHS